MVSEILPSSKVILIPLLIPIIKATPAKSPSPFVNISIPFCSPFCNRIINIIAIMKKKAAICSNHQSRIKTPTTIIKNPLKNNNKAIDILDGWLERNTPNAKKYTGKNHKGFFRIDCWVVTEAKKALGKTGTNWSI